MRGYNLALMFAPVASSEMGFAFANRSALLVGLNQFSSALTDIDFALQNNFPANLQTKLEARREKCQANIGDETEKGSEIRKYFYETFFTLKNPHPQIPTAEDCVKIDFREDRGRRVVATEAVPAGWTQSATISSKHVSHLSLSPILKCMLNFFCSNQEQIVSSCFFLVVDRNSNFD